MQVTTSINNIIVGKLNIDHGGVMHVRNLTHGLEAKMKFKQQGILQFRGEAHVVSPHIPPCFQLCPGLVVGHCSYPQPALEEVDRKDSAMSFNLLAGCGDL